MLSSPKSGNASPTTRAYVTGLATGISLAAFLVLIRFKVLGFPIRGTLFSAYFPKALLTGYYDVLYAGGLALLLGGLLLLLPGKARMLSKVYKIVAVLSLLAALANVQVVKMLGTPFNYQWFYYADFLNSTDTFYASLAGLSLKEILTAVGVGAAGSGAMLGLAALLYRGLHWLHRRTKRYALAALAVAAMAVYLPVANRYIHKKNFNPHKLANPVTAFLASVVRSVVTAPDLYTRQVPPHLNEFLTADADQEGLPGKLVGAPAPALRNVVFFVLESVPAEYVGNPKYTPELCKYLPEAVTFSNVYSHCPSTHNSMAALLTSTYPWISYKSITHEYPSIGLPSLSGTLQDQHFRTAFMHASDNRFQRMDDFLSHRGFDVQQDFRTLHCGTGVKEFKPAEGDYLNGVDDACVVRSLGHWLGNGDTTKPFFAMLWTMQTHYPYFLSSPEQKMGVSDPYQNRYLNALRHSDAVLGELLAELKRKGLYESTLVVVVGDHGEAFNDHAQYGHGNAIYEENVHVPLVLINPSLFRGETYATLGGHIDVAPTVLELLGIQCPAGWEGKSLFAANRRERTYFFAPWTDFKFGYRQGPYKVIYNATLSTIEVFDLTKDPDEQHNLADQMPELVNESYDRLAAWVQYEDKRFKANLLKSGLQ